MMQEIDEPIWVEAKRKISSSYEALAANKPGFRGAPFFL